MAKKTRARAKPNPTFGEGALIAAIEELKSSRETQKNQLQFLLSRVDTLAGSVTGLCEQVKSLGVGYDPVAKKTRSLQATGGDCISRIKFVADDAIKGNLPAAAAIEEVRK